VSDGIRRIEAVAPGLPYLSACDLKRGNISLADLDVGDTRPNLVDDAAELVAEDVALLHLDDCAVKQVQVTSTDRGSCDLQDYISILENPWLRNVHYGGLAVDQQGVLRHLQGEATARDTYRLPPSASPAKPMLSWFHWGRLHPHNWKHPA
jgi:hypothetical protein